MELKIKILNENAVIPTRGSKGAAGYDLSSCRNCDIEPHTTEKIGTGLAIQIPHGYFGGIFARSGLALKEGLRPANCTGILDQDYTGEVIVALHNDSNETRHIPLGERVAQLIVIPYCNLPIRIVKELDTTERGDDGFGSTGKGAINNNVFAHTFEYKPVDVGDVELPNDNIVPVSEDGISVTLYTAATVSSAK